MAGPDPVKGNTIPIGNLRIQDDGNGTVNLDKDTATSIDKPGAQVPPAKVEEFFKGKGLNHINRARWKDLQSYVQHIDAASTAATRADRGGINKELQLAKEVALKAGLSIDELDVKEKLLSTEIEALNKRESALLSELNKLTNSQQDALRGLGLMSELNSLVSRRNSVLTELIIVQHDKSSKLITDRTRLLIEIQEKTDATSKALQDRIRQLNRATDWH